jgi:hypothetical protein
MSAISDFIQADLAPVQPDSTGMPGAQAINTLLQWACYLGLVACLFGAIFSGGAIALGMTGKHPHWAERGKVGVLASIIGAVVIGSAVNIVNRGFHLA